MAEGPGADRQREGIPFLLSLGKPGLPQSQTESSPPYLAGAVPVYIVSYHLSLITQVSYASKLWLASQNVNIYPVKLIESFLYRSYCVVQMQI